MRKLLLLGSRGFTGSYVKQFVLESDLWALYEGYQENIDITKIESFKNAVNRIKPDAIINLAGISGLETPNTPLIYEMNGLAVVYMMDYLNEIAFQGRFVNTSSALVYGLDTPDIINETAPLNPAHHYSCAKAMADHALGIYSSSLDFVATRPFNFIGVGQPNKYLITKIISHFQKRKSTIELGNIGVARDFVDIRNVALMYLSIINDNAPESFINLCSGEARSITHVLDTLTKITGHEIEIIQNPDFMRAKDNLYQKGDNMNILKTGFKYHYAFEETLSWIYKEMDVCGV